MNQNAKAPQTLNGFPVKAVRWIDDNHCVVIVHRENDKYCPWVVAQWGPMLNDTWIRGAYGTSWQWADDLASKIAAEYRRAAE